MLFGVGVAVEVEVEADWGEAVLEIKGNGVLVVVLRFERDHASAGLACGGLNSCHERRADSSAALLRVEYVQIGDPISSVPFFEIAFDKTDEAIAFKGAIGVWIGQPAFQHEGRVADFLWRGKWFADEFETGR